MKGIFLIIIGLIVLSGILSEGEAIKNAGDQVSLIQTAQTTNQGQVQSAQNKQNAQNMQNAQNVQSQSPGQGAPKPQAPGAATQPIACKKEEEKPPEDRSFIGRIVEMFKQIGKLVRIAQKQFGEWIMKSTEEQHIKIVGSFKKIMGSLEKSYSGIMENITNFNNTLNKAKISIFFFVKLVYKRRLNQKKAEFKRISKKIEELKKKHANVKTECNDFEKCSDCLVHKACIWCPTEEKCVLGTKNGPILEKCKRFVTKVCPSNTCMHHFDCQVRFKAERS